MVIGGGHVPRPQSTQVHISKKWWVGQPQVEEEGWDMEGRAMTRGQAQRGGEGREGKGGKGREGRGGREGEGGKGRGGEGMPRSSMSIHVAFCCCGYSI